MKLSIIIPTINESACISGVLNHLQYLRRLNHQIIVVDGGSTDNTAAIANPLCDKFITTAPGRALQMHSASKVATGDIFLFLHADTILPDDFELLLGQLAGNFWGHFKIKLDGKHWIYRVIEQSINLRTRFSGIVTGDQCIFVSSVLYRECGGYPQIELMEDIAFSKRLNKFCNCLHLTPSALSSSRRWQKHGILKTILTMWLIRGLYFFGIAPAKLADLYARNDI